VSSKAGRDKGKYYLVIGIDKDFVYVADGETRSVANPKKKNPRHLTVHKGVNELIGRKIQARDEVTDQEVRQALVDLGIQAIE
jgi:ribosomal protein L14E/L6E/L27E